MKTPTFRASLFLPIACLVILAAPAEAGNPLTSISGGLKKVGSALNPFKKAAPPPKALPAVKAAPAPVKKPKPVKSAAPLKKKPPAKSYNSGAAQRKAEAAPRRAKPTPPKSRPTQPSATLPRAAPIPDTPPDPIPLPVDPVSTPASATPEGVPDVPPPQPPADADGDADGDADADASTDATPKPKEIPFGTPVMGRKGFVHSPWAKDQGMVDVSGITAGAKVKCPFSGKVFRVP